MHLRTHIDTLADNTPKARRRVRRLNGIGSGWPMNANLIAAAQHVARADEHREADRVAAMTVDERKTYSLGRR